MAYSDKVVEHYNNPRNVGSLPKEDPNVGTGLVGAPECGDVMKLQMKINPDTKIIEEAKFKTFGCGSAIASSSLATEWVKGKTVEEALSIKNTEDSLFRARRRCHQGRHRRLEKEAQHRSPRTREAVALRAFFVVALLAAPAFDFVGAQNAVPQYSKMPPFWHLGF
jgi:NifU-like protein involved in Fe-S cluster formation